MIAEALSHLQHSGVIVLASAIDWAHIDALTAVLAPESAVLAIEPGQHFNFGIHMGNINQGPLTVEPLMFPDVRANPIVLTILTLVLGLWPVLDIDSGNIALQVEALARQSVHADIDFSRPGFFFMFAVNTPLFDTTAANG